MQDIALGYEVGTGAPVRIPIAHTAVTGQTQSAGKTTALEAMVTRSGLTALTFVTKRGEKSFQSGHRVQPYFRDRADWQFVTSIIDATLQEKNKFLRSWIIKICNNTKTLADVHRAVQRALRKATGVNEGVYTQLDAYLEMIVPEIEAAELAPTLDLRPGLNVMDVSGFALPMQMLFVQSALDWVNERSQDTVVVLPEAWEFIPEGKGSPVKASAVALVRKGANLKNFIWVDSQDMAGVDKVVLRGCTVWLIGVQREANEIKRALTNIPAGISRPSAADIATLERGQFYVCWGRYCVKTYVQPAWMAEQTAIGIATGRTTPDQFTPPPTPPKQEPTAVTPKEADALRAENARLQDRVNSMESTITNLKRQGDELRERLGIGSDGHPVKAPGLQEHQHRGAPTATNTAAPSPPNYGPTMQDFLAEFRRQAAHDAVLLELLRIQPEIEVRVERRTVTIDGSTPKGRIVLLLANGFFDEGATNNATRGELKRTGPDVNNANIGRYLGELQRDRFLTLEDSGAFKAVAGMKSNIRQSGG